MFSRTKWVNGQLEPSDYQLAQDSADLRHLRLWTMSMWDLNQRMNILGEEEDILEQWHRYAAGPAVRPVRVPDFLVHEYSLTSLSEMSNVTAMRIGRRLDVVRQTRTQIWNMIIDSSLADLAAQRRVSGRQEQRQQPSRAQSRLQQPVQNPTYQQAQPQVSHRDQDSVPFVLANRQPFFAGMNSDNQVSLYHAAQLRAQQQQQTERQANSGPQQSVSQGHPTEHPREDSPEPLQRLADLSLAPGTIRATARPFVMPEIPSAPVGAIRFADNRQTLRREWPPQQAMPGAGVSHAERRRRWWRARNADSRRPQVDQGSVNGSVLAPSRGASAHAGVEWPALPRANAACVPAQPTTSSSRPAPQVPMASSSGPSWSTAAHRGAATSTIPPPTVPTLDPFRIAALDRAREARDLSNPTTDADVASRLYVLTRLVRSIEELALSNDSAIYEIQHRLRALAIVEMCLERRRLQLKRQD